MDGEKSAGLSPFPHRWQTAAQQPRPLSWLDMLIYGTDASSPETSLKPAETLLLKKAKEGKAIKKKRHVTLYLWYLTCGFVTELL